MASFRSSTLKKLVTNPATKDASTVVSKVVSDLEKQRTSKLADAGVNDSNDTTNKKKEHYCIYTLTYRDPEYMPDQDLPTAESTKSQYI